MKIGDMSPIEKIPSKTEEVEFYLLNVLLIYRLLMAVIAQLEIARKLSKLTDEEVQEATLKFLSSHPDLPPNKIIKLADLSFAADPEFAETVESFRVSERVPNCNIFQFFCYTLYEGSDEIEFIQTENGGEEVEAGNHWILPCREFEGLYESLIYEENLKEKLLSIVESQILFSQKKVDPNIISCNRLALLYGPPGTGKTSLCKAVAQKLAIRAKKLFDVTHLVEINCHSLFSKWFSESGKLVQKLFSKIQELVENPRALVCVLIDEVESIAYSRGSVSSSEPTDSLRVVNAVLTQLDRIRRFSNVLILTTSNVSQCIDPAFLDRADVIQYIGPPPVEAIHDIYVQALHELRRVGILEEFSDLPDSRSVIETDMNDPNVYELTNLARISLGLSGRNVRKIPLLTHSVFQRKESIDLTDFLEAMRATAEKQISEKKSLEALGALGNVVELDENFFSGSQLQDLQVVDQNGFALSPPIVNGAAVVTMNGI